MDVAESGNQKFRCYGFDMYVARTQAKIMLGNVTGKRAGTEDISKTHEALMSQKNVISQVMGIINFENKS